MTQGPAVLMVLEGDNAIARLARPHGRHRSCQGRRGDRRQGFRLLDRGQAVHGSDSPESAAIEIPYFFGPHEDPAR